MEKGKSSIKQYYFLYKIDLSSFKHINIQIENVTLRIKVPSGFVVTTIQCSVLLQITYFQLNKILVNHDI